MNSSRYLLARTALFFGLHRKNKRRSEAADEMHLLRQAEEILGEDVWEQTQDVEEISVEYWNLRKYHMDMAKLEQEINAANDILDTSHEERNTILNTTNDICQELESARDDLIKKSEQMIAKRDEIVSRAQQIKRRFDASRTKVAVLSNEDTMKYDSDSKTSIKEERGKLASYKKDFSRLKEERLEIGVSIDQIDQQITRIEDELAGDRKRLRDEAAVAYQSIGKANRDKSKLRAEVGIIENEMKQYYSEIGRYVSNHIGTDPICAEIGKDYSHLIAQMQSLRSSIALNHKLAAMAGV